MSFVGAESKPHTMSAKDWDEMIMSRKYTTFANLVEEDGFTVSVMLRGHTKGKAIRKDQRARALEHAKMGVKSNNIVAKLQEKLIRKKLLSGEIEVAEILYDKYAEKHDGLLGK